MGLSVISVDELVPGDKGTGSNSKIYTINNWMDEFDSEVQKVVLHFHTPLSLKKHSQVINTKFSFLDIIKATIRRLRDLKRYYGNDSNMGQINKKFYSCAKLIHCSTQNIKYQDKKRYSHSQNKFLPLSGFIGDVILTGNLQIFMPLLKATELVHIGRGTSSGNGFVTCT